MNLCLGTVQFGIKYGIQGNDQPQRKDIYDMFSFAIEHGISQFDTAAAYGKAEDVLGDFIRIQPEMAKKMSIVSKLKPTAFQDVDKVKWKEIAVKNARESLEKLGISCLTAYLFHNATNIFDEDAVTALNTVKNEGLTKCIGVSVYKPEEAVKALLYPQIGAIQIPYNLFDRRLDHCGFFKKAKQQGVVVYARSSLLQGLVVMDPENLPDRVRFAKDYLLKYDAICKEYSTSKLNAAIGYVTQKQGIDFIVFGVDNQKQLEEYISIENNQLPKEMINRIDEMFNEVPEKLVNPVLWK